MKKTYLLSALIVISTCGAFAQQQKPKKALPANWHLLSYETDSVYGVGAEKAYKELLPGKKSKKVIVAVLDTGIDTLHEDLKSILWTNKKEIANNSIDDDKNGYTDDVHGWSFLGSKDGKQNVVDASSEADREYARLLKKYNNDTTKISNQADRDYLQKLLPELPITSLKKQYAMTNEAYQGFVNLEKAIKATSHAETVTNEEVKLFQPDNKELETAKSRAMTVFYNATLKGTELSLATIIAQQKQYLESSEQKLKDAVNVKVDEHLVVGDNPNDINDRFYGNHVLFFPRSNHGTHVAGIVGAQRDNDNAARGVANNVEIMTVRVVPQGDEYDKDIACGIRYAVDNGAKILNMSFGKRISPGKQWIDDAMKYAESKGVLIVKAAGNDATNSDKIDAFPTKHTLKGGEINSFINVGASTPLGTAAGFSNYGQTQVDIFAPGVNIMSTMPNNTYSESQGTSMASPVVAGVAALVWSYYPSLTAAQIKDVLLKSATVLKDNEVPLPSNKKEKVKFGTLSATGGVVNAYNALKMAEELTKEAKGYSKKSGK